MTQETFDYLAKLLDQALHENPNLANNALKGSPVGDALRGAAGAIGEKGEQSGI